MQASAQFPEKLQPLFEPHRYKSMRGGRGGGKSWGAAIALLIIGIQRPIRVLCARETMESIQQSVHQLIRDKVSELGLQSEYEVQASRIVGRNGTLFTFAGLAHNIGNIKSLESYDYVWVEEAQTVSKDSWETLIPTIRKDGSEIWLTWNPKLVTDETYKRFVLNPPKSAWCCEINWQDNPWFPEVLRVEMEDLRERDYEAYLHVYEGQCVTSVEGAIFAKEIKQADSESRICNVPYNRTRPVDTVWDLGFHDMCAVWFVQLYDGWFRFIDYLEDSGLTIHDYIIELQQRKYVYGLDHIPYDGVDTIIHKKLAGDRTMSIEQLMRAAGRNVRIVPKVLVTDRINAGRTIFPHCRFDETKCALGLDRLRYYRWAPPSKLGIVAREPLHDIASHGGEAFTRAGQVLRTPQREVPKEKRVVQPPRRSTQGYAPFG